MRSLGTCLECAGITANWSSPRIRRTKLTHRSFKEKKTKQSESMGSAATNWNCALSYLWIELAYNARFDSICQLSNLRLPKRSAFALTKEAAVMHNNNTQEHYEPLYIQTPQSTQHLRQNPITQLTKYGNPATHPGYLRHDMIISKWLILVLNSSINSFTWPKLPKWRYDRIKVTNLDFKLVGINASVTKPPYLRNLRVPLKPPIL
jgi:hypothetical protein